MQMNFLTVFVFTVVGGGMVFLMLLVGKLLRPHHPGHYKNISYECGEIPVGSGWINFNYRFYMIALVFIIFDVEVALLFPIGTLYKRWVLQEKIVEAKTDASLQVARSKLKQEALRSRLRSVLLSSKLSAATKKKAETRLLQAEKQVVHAEKLVLKLGASTERALIVKDAQSAFSGARAADKKLPEAMQSGFLAARQTARSLRQPWGKIVLMEGFIFLAILLIGLIYVWARGDLGWVKDIVLAESAVDESSSAREE